MGRAERFKSIRIYRRKFISSFFLFFLLMIAGICIADYSINFLIKNSKEVEIISLKNSGTYLEISLMNRKFLLDMTYINRDYQSAIKLLRDIAGIK